MPNNKESLRKVLQEMLFLSDDLIDTFIATSPYRYKFYEIPKRNSAEMRKIAHPSKELKFIQRVMISQLMPLLPVHDNAYAYRNGRGIRENALVHASNSYLLKLDLSNFFNSLTPSILFAECKRNDISFCKDDKTIISNCLFYREHRKASLKLSVGAPSSPFISNAIMFSFDNFIYSACQKENIVYSRYADDMTFSTNNKGILINFDEVVRSALFKFFKSNLSLNNNKKTLSSKAHNRHITGITISNNNTISLGRDRKRSISASIHHFSMGKLNEDEIINLKGLLAFAEHIEPMFVSKMVEKYGAIVVGKLKVLKNS